jgi:phytoene dehydrogenase-like protein
VEPRYDAVVLGGGHHATIIACYLARAGLSVAVFERSVHLGGGASTSEGPAPGFLMNHCSHWTRFYGHPAYRDFGLYDEGLRYVFPEGNEAMAFDDGSAFVGYSAARVVDEETGRTEPWPEGYERTREQIRAFSGRDADTYARLHECFEEHWKPAFRRHRFSPPPPWGEPDALEALLEAPGSGIEPVHQFMSVRQLAYDFFASDELRTLFMRACTTSTGCFPDDVPGLQGLIHNLPLVLSFEPAAIAVGGSQAISDALVSAGRKLGAEYFASSEVVAIRSDGERASGIVLADGTEVGAGLVVSGLGVPQTVLRLLSGTEIGERLRHRISNVHYDRGQLLWANLALHEAPRYRASEVGPQPRLYWGPKDPDHFATRYQAEIYLHGFASRSFVLCSTDSQWDATRAPEGKHIVGVEEFSAPRRLFADWDAIKARFSDHLLEQWQRYAPNMTRENVLAMRVYAPDDIERNRPDMVQGGYSSGSTIASQLGRFRPVPELSGYRMVLENLYNCSANMHSGSGIGRGSSYNCFGAIAEDLGLVATEALAR